MSLNQTIIAALSPIAPIGFHQYTGTATTYMTFFVYNERSGLIADNDEVSTVYSIQVDVYSKGNAEAVAKQVKTKLKEHGFHRTTAMQLYNADNKTYRIMMSFSASFAN